jgi:predicted Zn-dependent protease
MVQAAESERTIRPVTGDRRIQEGIMSGRESRVRRLRPAIESLEERAVPATFGVPWSDPSHLTLSFVPDGTSIAGHTSSLFQLLGALGAPSAWQSEILRAFQTWAVNANINIGLVADDGQALGIAGAAQHDPRFGDIRVGAQSIAADALSVSVPNDPVVSSTLTGDILINTSDNFSKLKLFSVLLHEAGHVFGIGDSTDPSSPMYSQYLGNSQLTSGDVAALQTLYGTRSPDPHEGSNGNDTISTATTIQPPGSWTGTTPLIAYGDITTKKDVDVFAVRPPSGYRGAITIRLQSAGISLLAPHLSLLDAKGHVLAEAQAASDLGDVVTLHLAQSDPNATYYLKVQGATSDVFGIGGYGVAVTFDAASTVSTSAIDSVLRGPYQTLGPNDFNAIFLGTANPLFNNDDGSDDLLGAATTIAPSTGFARNSHYESVGSISGPTDSDFYRIQTADTPAGNKPLVLTVTNRALGVNGAAPRVTLVDRNGTAIPAQVLANGAGSFTVQAVGVKSGGWYFLKVGPATSAGSAAMGNYVLTAQFGTAAAQLSTFANGSLATVGAAQSFNLYVGESQLMNLVLSANVVGGAAAPGSKVQMTVLDAAGKVVYSLTAAAGDVVSGSALFLAPGAYRVRFTSLGSTSTGAPALAYNLVGDGISDPIGPVLTDPTLTPVYQAPGQPGWFQYPGGTKSQVSYLFSPALTA